ncbi:MAG: alpha/beta hydrolase [Erysipelotrichaceae bacterium]
MKYLKITSKQDELELGVTIIEPKGKPIAIIQLVHGMAEHRQRYESFMEELSQAGFICVIHDHRGHGDSIKEEEDYGYFYEDGVNSTIEDVHQISEYIKYLYPNLPLILFGHSMGSLVVRLYAKKYDDELAGLIVCGSPSENKAIPAAKLLVKFMLIFHNDHYRSKFIQKIGFGAYNRNIHQPASGNAWLCSLEDVVDEYDKDQGCGYIFTLNGFETLFTMMHETYSENNWQVKKPDLPILFISGEEDPCAESKQAFEKAVAFMKKVGYRQVDFKMYPKMRHEILNEANKEVVYQDVIHWIKKNDLSKIER